MLDIFGFSDSVADADDAGQGVTFESVAGNNGGGYGDVFGVLDKAGSFLGSVATTAGAFISAKNSIIADREKQQFETERTRLQSDLQRQQMRGAIDLEKYRTQAEIARAQGGMNMPGIGQLFSGGSGGGVGVNPGALVIMAALGFIAFKAFKKL